MKEAKNKFDGLLERIKLGETVQFGQMEELFAKALLGRFLEQLRSKDFRERAEQLHRERMLAQAQDIDEGIEIPELSERALVAYELDQARTAIGALGVRPELKQMQPYVKKAIDQRDWGLLNTVVSLTEEGRLEKGSLETIVLDALLRRPTREEGDTPSTVRAEFGEPHYTRELVEPVYARALAEGNIEGVKAVQDETKISIPPALVQMAYERLVGNGSAESMKQLVEVTGIEPKQTTALRAGLIKYIETQDVEKTTLDRLDAVLNITTNNALAKALQAAALRGGKVATFFDIYKRVGPRARSPINNVHAAYAQLVSRDAIDTIIDRAIQTGIAPRRETLTKLYSRLLEVNDFARMNELSAKTSTTPRFDDATVDATARNLVGSEGRHTFASAQLRDSLEPFVEFANLIHQAGSTIAEEYVERACQIYLESYVAGEEDRGLEGRIGVVNRLSTKLGVKPSEAITALKLERRVKELEVTLRGLVHKHTKEGWNLSPLEPSKGMNMKEWRQYSTAARTAVRKHIRDLQTIREAHPDCSVDQHLQKTGTGSGFIQETYTACLETFLTQCATDEETVNLPQLMQTVGIPMDENAVNRALINHILRNRGRQDARKVLENAQKAGVLITLNDAQINQIGGSVLERLGRRYGADIEGILYLKNLIGNRTLPEEFQELVHARSMSKLGTGDVEGYDQLQSVASIKRPPTPEEAKSIRDKAAELLIRGEAVDHSQLDAIMARAEIAFTATPEELEAMVNKYFEGGSNAEHPNHIARFFHAQLNPDQIRKRYEALLKDESIEGFGLITYSYPERIKAVQRLMNNTGIKYEPKDLQQRVEAEVNGNDSGAWPRWGPLLGLLTTHSVPPEQSTATRIYQASIQELSKLDYGCWFSVNELHLLNIVRRLRELNLPVEDAIAVKVKDLGLKSYGDCNEPYGSYNKRIITFMHWLNNIYGRADVLSPTELTTVADAIDREFTGNRIKAQHRTGTCIEDLSFIYVNGNRQAQANQRATLLYTESNQEVGHRNSRFPLYAYCAITGARPNVGPAELVKLRQEAQDVISVAKFTVKQKEHFVKMINTWLGETV